MNLLTPDDVLYGVRRKSVCSGSIGSSTAATGGDSGGKFPSKKEKRRRGSLSEPVPLRRASLVQRWFKHISDAAEAYKSRTRGAHDLNTDAVSGGGSKEKDSSFEMTPERTELPGLSSGGSSLDQPSTEKKPRAEAREKRKSQKHQQKPQDVAPRRSRSKQKKDSEESRDSANEDDEAEQPQQQQDDRPEGEEDPEADDEKRIEDDESTVVSKQKFNGYTNSCNTRTLTQQCSLVAPSEVQVTVSPSMTAEPVLTLAEQLRRVDESIKKMLQEKQRIVCDMFRMPNEHFSAIADIAGQPEAPKDPSDLVLAAFAQVQQLTETVNEFTRVSQIQEISAVSAGVCDDCHKSRQNARSQHPVLTREDSIQEDEDGYCEIVELRTIGPPPPPQPAAASAVASAATTRSDQVVLKRRSTNSIPEETESEMRSEAQQQQQSSGGRIEINETYVGADEKPKLDPDAAASVVDAAGKELCGPNRLLHATSLTPSVPCHLISTHTVALNTLVSQLLPKLNERDIERDMLRRENQHLRELINSLHERERVSSTEETPQLDADGGATATSSKKAPSVDKI